MLDWLKTLDRVLRGEATSLAALKDGELDIPIWGLCIVIDALGLLYGLCMGVFDLTAGGANAWKQTVSCMMKVPALFLLTLVVTVPSLYVFNAMLGSRLKFRSMVRLLVASLAIMLTVLASIGPIVAFFSFTTTSYSFMLLLNVMVFGIAGCLGLVFLLRSLHRLTAFQAMLIAAQTESDFPAVDPLTPSPLDRTPDHHLGRHVRSVFQIWVLMFALVGTQMAWVLSPFLGHPNQGFMLFRPTGSNFFQGVLENLDNLMR